MVTERFALNTTQSNALNKDLATYLTFAGVINNEIFSFMSDSSSWPSPSTAGKNGMALSSISVPVILLLAQLAKHAHKMIKEGYFLDTNVKYGDFNDWVEALTSTTNVTKSGSGGTTESKIPAFTLPLFKGTSIKGDKYLEDIVRTFTSNAMQQYIEDEDFCTRNAQWSGAFASRLRESIAESDILSFIATEEESNTNCAKVFNVIKNNLSSADITMARDMSHWNQLFGLKCEEKDNFLLFYSRAKSLIFKLKRDKSVAVTDDTFLRAYFTKVIEVPELQTEVKKLVNDRTGTYDTVLDLILKDYRAQETGDALRDVPLKPSAVMRRGKVDSSTGRDESKEDGEIVKKQYYKFPSNESGLIPSYIFTQFREWYNHVIVPKNMRTKEDEAWFRNFRLNLNKPPPYIGGRKHDYHPGSGHGDRDKNMGNGGRGYGSGNYNGTNRYSTDGRNGGDLRGRRAERDVDDQHGLSDRDRDFEDFLNWKNSRKRGSNQLDSNGNGEGDDFRIRRRVQFG